MDGLAAGMAEMGRLYEEEECYVPELMVSSEALYAGLDILQPLVVQSAGTSSAQGGGRHRRRAGRHPRHRQEPGEDDAGGLRASRCTTWAATWIWRPSSRNARRSNADLLCLSALMTTTIIAIKDYMPEFKAKLPRTKIMIGGAPLNQQLADEWGADGYGENAMEAARVAAALCWRVEPCGTRR